MSEQTTNPPDNQTTDLTVDNNTVVMQKWWDGLQQPLMKVGTHTIGVDSTEKPVTAPFFPDLTGVWAIEEKAGRFMYIMLNKYVESGCNLTAMYPESSMNYKASSRYGKTTMERYVTWYEGDVACVNISGTLMRNEPPSSMFGESAITYRQLTDVVSELASTESARRIVLRFSSFGGNTLGVFPCADSIAEANKIKPIMAYVDDNCASAAYLLASQCKEIIAAEGSLIGSIGTVTVLVDDSKKNEALGIKRVVVASSPIKSYGLDGKVTDDFKDNMQQKVDQTQEYFRSKVMSGRGMSEKEVTAVSDGDVHFPEDSIKLKLIDKIANFHDLFDIETESDRPTSNRRSDKTTGGSDDMSDQDMNTKDQVIAELQAKVEGYENKEKEARIIKAAAQEAVIQVKDSVKPATTELVMTTETVVDDELVVTTEGSSVEENSPSENARFEKLEQELAEQRERNTAMEAQMEATNKANDAKEDVFRAKLISNWVDKMVMDNRILPSDSNQVKMLLGTMIVSRDQMSIDCPLADGTVKKFEGQHYKIAMDVLESAFSTRMNFSERASSDTLNTEQRADIEADWLSQRMTVDGVEMDHEQSLGADAKSSIMGADLSRDVGVQNFMNEDGAVIP